ncbi:hypothetical protein INT43_005502 [Umbelopsis isabellina]|uniref:protein-tyrosine-phosphatase n=1 Tax=Mortierella isabellina TaxID=91625 RepID=A0A8H7PLM5_MORIS|nr:hypothetical protein INT43_005502 [Umbelopsis isabellina]
MSDEPGQEIIPHVWVGSYGSITSKHFLETNKIQNVISVCPCDDTLTGYNQMVVSILDVAEENIMKHFPDCNQFIQSSIDKSQNVLVHCEAGMSRSVTIVAAYLMWKRQISPKEAITIIKQAWPSASPNSGFFSQLELYHEIDYTVDQTRTEYRRYLMANMAEEREMHGYVAEMTLAADPEFHNSSSYSLRCKKCRRVLVDKDNIIEHEPGKGQQAFSYHKRDSSLNITETASGDQGEINTSANVNASLNPLLASLASSKNNCSSYFIEPMEWISNLDQWSIEGRLDCPRCNTKLGSYCWSGAQCSCGRWVTPAFTLHRKQVDEMKAVRLR